VESRTEPCPKGRKGKASGLVKLLCDAKGQILGPHGLGPRGGDLLQPLVVAMREKIPVARLSQIIHAIRPWSKLTAAPPTSLTAKAVRQRAGAVAADPGVLGDRERGPAMINKKKLLLVVVLLALIGLAIAFGHPRVESLLAQMRALGPWGPLAFILLYGIAPSLFVPGLPLTLAVCAMGPIGVWQVSPLSSLVKGGQRERMEGYPPKRSWGERHMLGLILLGYSVAMLLLSPRAERELSSAVGRIRRCEEG
jgi:hypothetical protein